MKELNSVEAYYTPPRERASSEDGQETPPAISMLRRKTEEKSSLLKDTIHGTYLVAFCGIFFLGIILLPPITSYFHYPTYAPALVISSQ
jgi:hypothetical protein